MKTPERRRSTLRRQFNESFCDANGHVAIAKVIAVAGQVMLLFHTGKHFERLTAQPETLLICLSFIIMPDMVKKFLTLKYGNGHAGAAK